jgi:hypothetical protein
MDFLTHLQGFTLFGCQSIQFATRNYAFRLGADADEDLARTDACNHTGANLAGLRQVDVQLLFVQQRLHRLIVVIIVLLFSLRIGITP